MAEKNEKTEKKVKMIKVVNDGYTESKVFKGYKETLPNGRENVVDIFSRDWIFPPKTEEGETKIVEIPEDEYKLMINPTDHTKCSIYTLEQYKRRLKIIAEQEQLRKKWKVTKDEDKQREILKQMNVGPDIEYLIQTDLPHAVK